MNKISSKLISTVSTFIGILILLGIPIFLFYIGKEFINLIKVLDKGVSAAIIATSGTILTAVISLIFTQYRTKKRDIVEAHRPEKVKTYSRFMQIVSYTLKNTKEDKGFLAEGEELPEDLLNLFFDFQRDLMAWGSPEVIQAYLRFRNGAYLKPTTAEMLLLVDDVLRQIRKDLGHSDSKLKAGELLSVFLANPSEVETLLK